MRIYTVYMEASISGVQTLIEVMNTANTLLRVLGLKITGEGSETSDQVAGELVRLSASGTGTAATPVKTDPGDPAAVFTAEVDHSAEPTYVAEAPEWSEGFNLLAGAKEAWSILEAPKIRPGTGNGIGLKLDVAPAAALTIRAELRIAEEG